MSDRSSPLYSQTDAIPADDPLLKSQLLKYHPHLAPPNLGEFIISTNPREGGADDVPFTKVIPLLSSEHQHLIESMIRELAKIEGIEIPDSSEGEPEPLGQYIHAWQNSLDTRGFSPSSMDLYRRLVDRLLAKVLPPINTIAIEEYIASRRESGISPTAIKSDLKAAKSFFGFLHERGIIASDPTAKLRHPKIVKREKVCPTAEEVAKFLAVLALAKNPRAKLMMCLFINTGIRFSEMATLTWGKVNLEGREITVLGKGSKWRRIPIASEVRDFLAELCAGHGDKELLFPTESQRGKWDNSDANKMIARICRRAGIRRYSCHQWRHYFATSSLKAGARLKVVQELLGHANASITLDFYDHTTEEEIRKTHEAFAPLLGEALKTKDYKEGSNGKGA